MNTDSLTNSEKNVIIIWVGQLLTICLKGDKNDIQTAMAALRNKIGELFNISSSQEQEKLICLATVVFCNKLGERFSLATEATDLLKIKLNKTFQNILHNQQYDAAIAELRTVDFLSGLSSSLNGTKMPLSLLDYILDMILPYIGGDTLGNLLQSIDQAFDKEIAEDQLLLKINTILTQLVKQLRLGLPSSTKTEYELKLAILMHLPKDDKDFAMKTGYIFKLFQLKQITLEVQNG